MSQYRRMLGWFQQGLRNGNYHAHGRHMHARLPLLQRED